jgi:gliding motility-associated protein GldE
MKSRVDVVAIEMTEAFNEIMEKILSSGFSRIPVYEETFDQIKGILYVKDLLPHLDEKKGFQWNSLIREAFFVPENKKISDLLKEFQEKKIHMAIIVDEYGGTSGLVTLEDIIEEIVGDITDEFDSHDEEVDYKRIDEHNYVFEGKTTINDFCKILGIEDSIFDEVKGDSDSLAGLILEMEGKIPEKQAVINFRNFDFVVKEADDRRIRRIKITIKTEQEEKGEG